MPTRILAVPFIELHNTSHTTHPHHHPHYCSGVLASHPASRDVHINDFSMTFHGVELLSDTQLELNLGRRYGLVGLNGSGEIMREYVHNVNPQISIQHTNLLFRWHNFYAINYFPPTTVLPCSLVVS